MQYCIRYTYILLLHTNEFIDRECFFFFRSLKCCHVNATLYNSHSEKFLFLFPSLFYFICLSWRFAFNFSSFFCLSFVCFENEIIRTLYIYTLSQWNFFFVNSRIIPCDRKKSNELRWAKVSV